MFLQYLLGSFALVPTRTQAQESVQEKGISLEELEVSLSVSAEGNIAFVGAKAEASILLKFKRS